MSYEILTAIVVINAIVTFSLWQQIATRANRGPRPNKKAAKSLWDSDPIVPRHDPPKVAGGRWSSVADDEDRAFFSDFKEFGDIANRLLLRDGLRFRLQELPDGNMSLFAGDDHPVPGRCFALFYNQTRLGGLEIFPSYGYTSEVPAVHAGVRIDWSRFLGFEELTHFLQTIANLVSNPRPDSDEYIAARRAIQSAVTETLWGNYRILQYDDPDFEDWGELNVMFEGPAEKYIRIRKTAATNNVDAAW
jgi:hypothetical protein